MFNKTSILVFSFIFFCILTNVASAEDKHHLNLSEAELDGMQTDRLLLIVKVTGTGVSYNMPVPGLEGEALCFDVDLLDLKNNQTIGTVTDCFSDVQPNEIGGVDFIGTTFLNFPDGTIVTRGEVSVRPAGETTILRTDQPITDITGSATTGNTFLEGTGIYQNSTGNTRISGMVDATNFTFNVDEPLFFDCIFEIEVDLDDNV